jgi:AcrR family transcriptional regulator
MERAAAGRPRDATIDERISEAARRILDEQGYGEITVSAVARAAGLPRSTVYRRHPSLVALRYSALYLPADGPAPLPDTGDIRADMRAHIAANARAFVGEERLHTMRALLIDVLSDDAARSDLALRYTMPRLEEVAARIDVAKQRGEVPATTDADVAARAITGTLIYHAVVLGQPVDDSTLEALLDLLFPA